MSTESSSQSSSGMHSQGSFGNSTEKRAREMPPPPNIPAGLRQAALPPSQAQRSMIDPRAQANNEALRQQQQQQQQDLLGQPPAKKARTELPPAGSEAAAEKSKQEAEEKQEPVPLDRKEYVNLLKAKAEAEDLAKKMLAMQEENKVLKEKNQGWQTAAALSLGNNADSASLREQYNLANEERASAAQIKVKEALKTGKEVKKLLQAAGKTPSPGTLDGLRRLEEYNKNPRQLLNKKCREDVMSLTGWLNDYNQARMLTVASKSKATAQLEAQLQTTQARYKDLEEQRELKNIGNGAPQYSNTSHSSFNRTGLPMHQQQQQQQPPPPKIPVPTQQQPPRHQQQQPQFQDYPAQDCWANAQNFQQQQQVMTTASGGSPGDAEQRYSSFYSKSSIPMSKSDPGPPLRRPPSNIKMNFTPFDTFYRAPISEEASQYGARLSQRFSIGTGQGIFTLPALCGKEYPKVGVELPNKWRPDDQFTFSRGRLYSS